MARKYIILIFVILLLSCFNSFSFAKNNNTINSIKVDNSFIGDSSKNFKDIIYKDLLIKKEFFGNDYYFSNIEKEDCNSEVFYQDSTQAPVMKEGWPKEYTSLAYWTGVLEPVVSDLDEDGEYEIIVYQGGDPTVLHVYKQNGDYFNGWPKQLESVALPGGNIRAASVADLDSDGYKEIIVNDMFNLYIFSYNGNLINTLNYDNARFDSPNSEVVIDDLNYDGNAEIIAKNRVYYESSCWNQLIVFNKDGEVLEGWPKLYHDHENYWAGSTYETSPAIGNFDDDPDKEIVIAEMRNIFDANGFHFGGKILVFNYDGSILEGFPRNIEGLVFASPTVGDIDKDGYDEIIIGTSNIIQSDYECWLYVINRQGEDVYNWPKLFRKSMWSSPSLADFNNDGYLEIIQGVGFFNSTYYDTYVFNYDGNIQPGWPQSKDWYSTGSAIIADINNDKKSDIITTTDKIYAWNSNGEPIEGFPFNWNNEYIWRIAIEDIDDDNKLELIGSGCSIGENTGHVCVWELNSEKTESKMDWPMKKHDPQQTSKFNYKSYNKNNPPEKPIITGQSEGKINENYKFTFSSNDPEDDNITYFIKWEDETYFNSYGPYNSNQEVNITHKWKKEKSYTIKIKSRDEHVAESQIETLDIKISNTKSKTNMYNLFEKLKENTFLLLMRIIKIRSIFH